MMGYVLNSPWGSSHEKSVILFSLNLAFVGLGGLGQEASSSNLPFVSLTESSLLGCIKVLLKVKPLCKLRYSSTQNPALESCCILSVPLRITRAPLPAHAFENGVEEDHSCRPFR